MHVPLEGLVSTFMIGLPGGTGVSVELDSPHWDDSAFDGVRSNLVLLRTRLGSLGLASPTALKGFS